MAKVSKKSGRLARKAFQPSTMDLQGVSKLFKSIYDKPPAPTSIESATKAKEDQKKKKKSIFNT